MARNPRARTTEIDSADDLLLAGGEEAPEEEEKGADQDEFPSLVEPEPEPAAGAAEPEEAAEAEPPEPERKKAPAVSSLRYFGVPAAGAVLILALGWTFAFIARQGLIPPKPEEKDIAEILALPKPPPVKRVEPKKPGPPPLKILVPAPTEAEIAKKMVPFVPDLIKPDDGQHMTLEEPFFIPLEGARANGRGARRARSVFAHFSVTISLSNKAVLREAKAKSSAIRAVIFEHFNRLSPRDLATQKAREASRKRLVARLSKEVVQGKVQAVFFDEFFTR